MIKYYVGHCWGWNIKLGTVGNNMVLGDEILCSMSFELISYGELKLLLLGVNKGLKKGWAEKIEIVKD